MATKIGKIVILSAMTVLIFADCATKIPLNVQRTPTLDTAGIRRIAIMLFEASSSNYQNTAVHATNVATTRIRDTNYFTLISASEIQRLRRANQSIESYVDALFNGQITNISQSTNQHQEQTTNRQGEKITYYYFIREVEVSFNYSLMRSHDGSLIGPVYKSGRTSARADTQGELPSVDALAAQIIDSQLSQLARDVAPYTTRITRSLEKESNKALRPQMNSALEQVKSGSYRAALESYLAIYRANLNIAAAINASILYEALGETRTAANFMQEVLSATGNPKAGDVLTRLNRELQHTAEVAQFSNTRSQAERVAGYANEEIRKVLPANARVWIHNNASANQSLANDVIDNLTSSFLRNGITVIDRESIALIIAEQNLQAGGYITDSDFVSIGNLAGANTIVIINITGTGATRRLQARVLDIERGVSIFQSDTGENWRL